MKSTKAAWRGSHKRIGYSLGTCVPCAYWGWEHGGEQAHLLGLAWRHIRSLATDGLTSSMPPESLLSQGTSGRVPKARQGSSHSPHPKDDCRSLWLPLFLTSYQQSSVFALPIIPSRCWQSLHTLQVDFRMKARDTQGSFHPGITQSGFFFMCATSSQHANVIWCPIRCKIIRPYLLQKWKTNHRYFQQQLRATKCFRKFPVTLTLAQTI